MTEPVSFEVAGMPAPQGSKTRMPNGAIIEGRDKGQRERHKNWRSAVADTARAIASLRDVVAPLDGPLHVTVTYRFPMPKSRSKVVREAGRAWKTSAPDIDKLDRATFDGLVAGGLIRDDAIIAEGEHRKIEVVGWTGAEIWIERLPATP